MKNDIDQIRQILLGLDSVELEKINRLLNYPDDLAREIANILPSAIIYSSNKNDKLSTALAPLVNKMIARSVAENPDMLANVLYPVIGKSIRKSINEEFKNLIRTFNELLENTLTMRSLKWRYQAIVTGKKYSEVVISNTLSYRVEHVFLIHKETGILLQDAHLNNDSARDADMVSGMLNAISSFIHDSFDNTSKSSLNSVEIDEYELVIEDGPYATIAALIRGYVPENYRKNLQTILENTHKNYENQLINFSGETGIFEMIKPDLEQCLKSEMKNNSQKPKTKAGNWILGFVIIFIVFILGQNLFFQFRWNKLKKELYNSKNIIIATDGKESGRFFMNGFFLPGTIHPDSIVGQYMFRKAPETSWHLIIPGNELVVLNFLENRIDIPKNFRLNIKNETIILSGLASDKQINYLKSAIKSMLPTYTINTENIDIVNNKLIESVITDIEVHRYYFETGKDEISINQEEELNLLAQKLETLEQYCSIAHKKFKLVLTGYTDNIGDSIYNKVLSKKRAEELAEKINKTYKKPLNITTKGAGHQSNIVTKTDSTLRRVEISVILKNDK